MSAVNQFTIATRGEASMDLEFTPLPLGDKDFTNVKSNKIIYVVGNNQWVYWKDCSFLTVFKNKQGEPDPTLSGRIRLKKGMDLYFIDGMVIDEKVNTEEVIDGEVKRR